MRKIVKTILNITYRPVLVKYLSVARSHTYKGIGFSVYPGVFHPLFFYSTKLLLRHIERFPLKNRSFLELGAGSGLISLAAARDGAHVTATDINPRAVECIEANKALNGIDMEVLHSDLFEKIPPRPFDIIAVNPPYYRRRPNSDAERAWYCGENGEYFDRFFSGLRPYTHPGSEVWMILSDGCDVDMVQALAGRYGWRLNCCATSSNWVELNYIFRIERSGIP
ncbi:methyltransferase [Puia dinghuensis]|uniref:Methyltransferase small domain-containing protein n=1 Tax=Puia dinghuensis TaxID=1792502 RepID=A0A8J2UD31_9BACT|nr:methyltransferase [Puia dinghuensis]GGA99895.1 hypothetical protein GCM10011511_24000 [Puia dinghuensis]